jgi:hypothetical protein
MALRLACFFVLLLSCAEAASPHKEPLVFSFTGDVGFGNSVFVVGNHPDVGDWDVTRAVKLRYTAGNIWTGQIAVQSGTQLQYRFLSRGTAQEQWCEPSNAGYLTGVLTRSVPAQPAAPYVGKTVYYLSGWTTPKISYRSGVNWIVSDLVNVGPGRSAGESLFKISSLSEAGEPLEFVFTDGNNHYDNPPGGGNYLTNLDVFRVQDGNVFSYSPPPSLSAPQIVTQFVNSTAPNIPGRTVRVYLPRG